MCPEACAMNVFTDAFASYAFIKTEKMITTED